MENIERKTYQPKLGDANRYENSRGLNQSFAEHINQEALYVVQHAQSILEKVKQNPDLKNHHDPKTNGQWMGDWLVSQKDHIVRQLYGVFQLQGLPEIPKEVEQFVKDVYQVVGR